MNALAEGPMFERRAGLNGLAWLGGVLATTVAAMIGAVLAVFFAATVAVIALMAAALLAVVNLAVRARRATRAPARSSEPDILEARHVGGHSWVAYGWDRQGR
jgi:hypothetical protein